MAALKVTIDNGLLRERVLDPFIRTLRTWELEGKIELFESDRTKETANNSWPGGPPAFSRSISRYVRPSKRQYGQPSFNDVSLVLFPSRDSTRLAMNEVNSVARLLSHRLAKRSFFITNNDADYIQDGKQEKIRRILDVVVLTPEQAVQQIFKLIDQDLKKSRGS